MRNPGDVALAIAFGVSCTDISEETKVWIPYREEIASLMDEFISGIKTTMGYAGASSIMELRRMSRIARVVLKKERIGISIEQLK